MTNFNLIEFSKVILLRLNLFDIVKKYVALFNILRKVNHYKEFNFTEDFFKLYVPPIKINKGDQIKKLFSKIEIDIPEEGFIFFIDQFKTVNGYYQIINNISIDYSKIIHNSIDDMLIKYKNKDDEYSINQITTLEAIIILINRIINKLELSNRKDKEKYIAFFERIKSSQAVTFEEALQRILFFNQILWQTNHTLNGFGRLDKVLNEIYEKDSISNNEALDLIKNFLKVAHTYYHYKSSVMVGDTGQIIVVGGLNQDDTYFSNDLTYLFIEAVNELQLPDPKIILRYSHKIPRNIIESSLKCMATGVGSPLLSNDDIIINHLINFGYNKEDAYNYVVSACWEPAPIGKGFEMNNVDSLIFIKPLNNLLDNENLDNFKDFNSFLNKYQDYLADYINVKLNKINTMHWEVDPLMSLFIEGCDETCKDIVKGGAIYNNYGLTSVSLSNTINCLLNIKYLVFNNHEFSLHELNEHRLNNFDDENVLVKIKQQTLKFGKDNTEIINLTNLILNHTNNIFKEHNTKFGGKFKFGLSSPSYIMGANDVKASCDGRKDFEPFNVHISLDDNKDYTELMRFASKLDYSESRFNGNVVDFMVSPDFINKNFDKFLDFLILSMDMGVFQIQLNVVDSKTLIDAKLHPDKYPNLIVRVWGFSSYFKDLPDSYQDLLIKRALDNEGKNN